MLWRFTIEFWKGVAIAAAGLMVLYVFLKFALFPVLNVVFGYN